ncbi:hypothetical protein GGD65_006052 [Bradyrhizobium sp. CIR18]|nr:hypothetical protein [Bradyrhizobium sp. CIR18]
MKKKFCTKRTKLRNAVTDFPLNFLAADDFLLSLA